MASAFADGQRAMAAVLLAYAGSRTFIDLETYDRSVAAKYVLLSHCDLGSEPAFGFQVPNKANTPFKRERNIGSYALASRLRRR